MLIMTRSSWYSHTSLVGIYNFSTTVETSLTVFCEVKYILTDLILPIYPREMKTSVHIIICIQVFITVSVTVV